MACLKATSFFAVGKSHFLVSASSCHLSYDLLMLDNLPYTFNKKAVTIATACMQTCVSINWQVNPRFPEQVQVLQPVLLPPLLVQVQVRVQD